MRWRRRSRRAAAAAAGERQRQSRRAAAAAAALHCCDEQRLARSVRLQRPEHPCGNHSVSWQTRQTWARKRPAVVAVIAAVVVAVVVVVVVVARQRSGRRARVQCASRRASGTGSEHMHTQDTT